MATLGSYTNKQLMPRTRTRHLERELSPEGPDSGWHIQSWIGCDAVLEMG